MSFGFDGFFNIIILMTLVIKTENFPIKFDVKNLFYVNLISIYLFEGENFGVGC